MVVIEETTRKKVNKYTTVRGIVYEDDNYKEYGYFKHNNKVLTRITDDGSLEYDISEKGKTMKKIFSKEVGHYIIIENNDNNLVYRHLNTYGKGSFPYNIDREYEAEKHLKLFNQEVSKIEDMTNFRISPYLKYSFGIEFETAAGYLPENKCFELGLIPLRDGSISGVEYSTIPLKGNEGLNLLKKQMECLKEHTVTNKECSVHIHLGGYPVDSRSIFILHSLWYYLQYDMCHYIPKHSYNTEQFKATGKSYCKPVDIFASFKDLYRYYAQTKYLGSLYQPHPYDTDKKAKWNIKTRYYNCNFINMLCYDSAKTVEFRFLTPTYSFEKLTTFLMIFNAILLYAERFTSECEGMSEKDIFCKLDNMYFKSSLTIKKIISIVYSKDIVDYLNDELLKLTCLKDTQHNVGDYCGARLDIENKYFTDGQ